jgi:hypothetical protein
MRKSRDMRDIHTGNEALVSEDLCQCQQCSSRLSRDPDSTHTVHKDIRAQASSSSYRRLGETDTHMLLLLFLEHHRCGSDPEWSTPHWSSTAARGDTQTSFPFRSSTQSMGANTEDSFCYIGIRVLTKERISY